MEGGEWRSIRGHGRISMRAGSLPTVQLRGNSGDNFFDADGFHAAEIDGAFAEETGTAFDLMPKNVVTNSQRSGQARLSRSENGDNRNSDERGQVHRAGVVRQQQRAFTELGGELVERGLADSIQAMRAES